MATASRLRFRTVLRRVHLGTAVSVMAYVYGPATLADQLQLPLRLVLLPALALSGIVMWQLPRWRRVTARRTVSGAS